VNNTPLHKGNADSTKKTPTLTAMFKPSAAEKDTVIQAETLFANFDAEHIFHFLLLTTSLTS